MYQVSLQVCCIHLSYKEYVEKAVQIKAQLKELEKDVKVMMSPIMPKTKLQ